MKKRKKLKLKKESYWEKLEKSLKQIVKISMRKNTPLYNKPLENSNSEGFTISFPIKEE